jgi:hypothetical protein
MMMMTPVVRVARAGGVRHSCVTEFNSANESRFLALNLTLHRQIEPLQEILKWVQILKNVHMSQNNFEPQKNWPQKTWHSWKKGVGKNLSSSLSLKL